MSKLFLVVFGKNVPVGKITVYKRVIDPQKVFIGGLVVYALLSGSGH